MSCCCDFCGTFGLNLSLYVRKISLSTRGKVRDVSGRQWPRRLLTSEHHYEFGEVVRAICLNSLNQCDLLSVCRRNVERNPHLPRKKRRRNSAPYPPQSSVKCKLAHIESFGAFLERTSCLDHSESDGKVKKRALFRNVSRGKIDGDFALQVESERTQGSLHTFTRLTDCNVRHSDNRNRKKPSSNLNLNFNRKSLHSSKRYARNTAHDFLRLLSMSMYPPAITTASPMQASVMTWRYSFSKF